MNSVAAKFLETADPKSLEVACVAHIHRQPFILKSDGKHQRARAGPLPVSQRGHLVYFALTCSSQPLARPAPFRNGRAASTSCGARPIS